jgi:hypothetical protein
LATPAEFGKLIADDTEKWAKVKFAGIKPDYANRHHAMSRNSR